VRGVLTALGFLDSGQALDLKILKRWELPALRNPKIVAVRAEKPKKTTSVLMPIAILIRGGAL